jgi:hypothetical protein
MKKQFDRKGRLEREGDEVQIPRDLRGLGGSIVFPV